MKTHAEHMAESEALRRRWLQSLAKSGKSISDVARIVGADRSALSKMALRYGVEWPRVVVTPNMQFTRGMTPDQIAVYRVLKKAYPARIASAKARGAMK